MKDRLYPIEIPRRGRLCSLTSEQFQPGSEYFSLLIEEDNEKWQRMDFCLACWPEAKKKFSEQIHTYWKAQVPIEQDKTELHRNRNEKALELLKSALQGETDEEKAEAFVLALFLVRSRILALRQQIMRDGCKVGLYEVLASEEMLPVRLLPLSQLQVEKLQVQLAKKLGSRVERANS